MAKGLNQRNFNEIEAEQKHIKIAIEKRVKTKK